MTRRNVFTSLDKSLNKTVYLSSLCFVSPWTSPELSFSDPLHVGNPSHFVVYSKKVPHRDTINKTTVKEDNFSPALETVTLEHLVSTIYPVNLEKGLRLSKNDPCVFDLRENPCLPRTLQNPNVSLVWRKQRGGLSWPGVHREFRERKTQRWRRSLSFEYV